MNIQKIRDSVKGVNKIQNDEKTEQTIHTNVRSQREWKIIQSQKMTIQISL